MPSVIWVNEPVRPELKLTDPVAVNPETDPDKNISPVCVTSPVNTEPESVATTPSSIDSADPAPPFRPVPAAAAAIRRLSEPSSSRPVPAKSDGSIVSSVESILRPPDDFKSKLNVVDVRSKPSPAVY